MGARQPWGTGTVSSGLICTDVLCCHRAFEGYTAEWESVTSGVQVLYTLALLPEKKDGREAPKAGEANHGHGVPGEMRLWVLESVVLRRSVL